MTTATAPALGLDARRALCAAKRVTLDGKPARITMARGTRALVVANDDSRAHHYTWTATARIVAAGGAFKS